MRRAVGILTAVVLLMTAGAAFAQRAPEPDAAGVSAEPVEVMAPGLADELAAAPAGKDLTVFVHANTIGDAKKAATTAGLQVVAQFDRVGVAAALGTAEEIAAVALDPSVRYVEPDSAVEYYLDTAHQATGADDARDASFGLLDANDNPFDGTGITIAINDSGVDGTHPMFNEAGETKLIRNMRQLCVNAVVCDLWFPVDDSDPANGHGTHVAGIAGGYERTTANGRLVRGAAPGASLLGLGSGAGLSILASASGMNWVLQNHEDPCFNGQCPPIKVINNSWGGTGRFDPKSVITRLSNELVADGVVVIFAAGNGDTAGDGGNGSDDRVNAHAKNPTPGVIGVANYDDAGSGSRNNALDSSSSRGLKTDPATYPDLAAPGAYITSACTYILPICRSYGDIADPYYAEISGTSMAAPYVAGIVALLLQADPTLTPAEIEDVLEDTAHKFGDQADFVADPSNADDTTSFDRGHGLIDVTQALARVLNRTVGGGGGPACGAGAGIVDPAGDATDVLLPTPAPSSASEKTLDITGASITTHPTTGALTFTVTVDDLGELPPTAAVGEYVRFYFTFGGTEYLLIMDRLGGSAVNDTSFRLTTGGLTSTTVANDLAGSFDPAADTVSATVPANALNTWKSELPVIIDGDQLSGLRVMTQRQLPPFTLTADTAQGSCPYIVGT